MPEALNELADLGALRAAKPTNVVIDRTGDTDLVIEFIRESPGPKGLMQRHYSVAAGTETVILARSGDPAGDAAAIRKAVADTLATIPLEPP